MAKFRLLREQLAHGPYEVIKPSPATWAQLASVHAEAYLQALSEGTLPARAQRRIGFDCTPALFERCRLETGGTLRAVELALQQGLACNAAGGTHHAHHDYGSGYCLLNDLAVAAHWAHARLGVGRVLIIDCDVHQGDGTATLLAGVPWAFTFSMHCAENFPARKPRSDFDLALPRGTGDEAYLAELCGLLPWLLEQVQPELVLYDAGVDVHVEDRLGHLALTDAGLLARDEAVLRACRRRGIATACVIGGGYDRDLDRLARRHALLFEAAARVLSGTDSARDPSSA
jgi:acetoin utilization deacetylase AcuC-like enzyme